MTLNPKLDSSCVLCLPFEEDSGSIAYDQSLYNNNGTIYGATRTLGKLRKALSFDGVDDYVQIPYSTSIEQRDKVSFLCWFKCSDVSKESYLYVRDTGSGTGENLYVRIYNGYVWFYLAGTSNAGWHQSVSQVFNAIWYHLAVTYDRNVGKGRLYLNGLLDKEINSTGSMEASTNPATIGKRINSFWYEGIVDEVRLYNRALSAKEIYEHYIYGIQSLRRPRLREFRKEVRRKLWPEISV